MIQTRTSSAIVYTLCLSKVDPGSCCSYLAINKADRFVSSQIQRMPKLLRIGTRIIIFLFWLTTLITDRNYFNLLPFEKKKKVLSNWKNSRLGFQRDFVRLFDTLATLGFFSFNDSATPINTKIHSDKYADHLIPENNISQEVDLIRSEICIIGSGPGGSTTAEILASHGKEVILIEEGPCFDLRSSIPFSIEEMTQKYRSGGITPALGKPSIAYVEGKCLGGGSEINSGLYHRTPSEVLDRWKRDFDLKDASIKDLEPHFSILERQLSVCTMPGNIPLASLKLHQGAEKLGWKSIEVPRWYSYSGQKDEHGIPTGIKQSMTETFIPTFIKNGGKILSQTHVQKIERKGSQWLVHGIRTLLNGNKQPLQIMAKTVFIAGGAIQTPVLLQRSGLSELAGKRFQVHPTIKITAKFREKVNSLNSGVPVHQVKEFFPNLSMGCSISSLPYLATNLLDYPDALSSLRTQWQQMATYYAMITPEGMGKIKAIPGLQDPLVTYKLVRQDYLALRMGLKKLAKVLISAGAVELYPSIAGGIYGTTDTISNSDSFTNEQMSLMTIHLFSSCPIGENQRHCVADSYGKVHGQENLYIADGSMLPTALGVNPQGSILAFARRNALSYLKG